MQRTKKKKVQQNCGVFIAKTENWGSEGVDLFYRNTANMNDKQNGASLHQEIFYC